MINTGFPLIYKPQWQAQHAPDFAWHCDLMKREGLEEDYEGGGGQPFYIGPENSWLIYHLLTSKSWSGGFCVW